MPSDRAIRERAYRLWEQDKARSAQENWFLAKQQLEQEASAEGHGIVGGKRVGLIGSTSASQAPPWIKGLMEKPGATKDMGTWRAGVFTAEQQQRLGIDEWGQTLPAANAEPITARVENVPVKSSGPGPVGDWPDAEPPAWTKGKIEPPNEKKDMGGWVAMVYSAEQQTRLNVDEWGDPVEKVSKPMKGLGAIGPAWTRGEIEAPKGSKNMGSWVAAVYTEEQQQRLHVTELGEKI